MSVDPDPAPLQSVRDFDRRTAPAKRVEHDVAFASRGPDDPGQQRLRLLRRVIRGPALPHEVGNDVLYRHAFREVQIDLAAWSASGLRGPVDFTVCVQFVQTMLREFPDVDNAAPLVFVASSRQAAGLQRGGHIPAATVLMPIALGDIGVVIGNPRFAGPCEGIRHRVEQQGIVDFPPPPGVVVRRHPFPDDLVAEIPEPENPVHDDLDVMADRRVAVHVDGAGRLQDFLEQNEALRHIHQIIEELLLVRRTLLQHLDPEQDELPE